MAIRATHAANDLVDSTDFSEIVLLRDAYMKDAAGRVVRATKCGIGTAANLDEDKTL